MPRNTLGFTPATAGGSCERPMAVVPRFPGDATQAVDSLIVRNQLITNKHLGAALTLTGTGGPNPTFEAALCVQAGASIHGLSEHGLLRVRGESCMRGPLSVSNLYGPVTVSQNPDPSATVSDTQLTVQGATETATLLADTALVGALEADSAEVGVLNTDVFTVAGVPAGPFAAAELTALYSNALVGIRVSSSVFVTGIAISTSEVVAAVLGGGLPVNSTVYTIVKPIFGGKSTTVTATVVRNLPACNLTLFALVTGEPAFSVHVAIEDPASPAVSPFAGTPLLVGCVDSSTGAFGFVNATVRDPDGQLVVPFTALHLDMQSTQALDDTAIGAPVINYHGNLVGTVVYGTPAAGVAGTGYGINSVPLATVVGAVKAPFIYRLKYGPDSSGVVPLNLITTITGRPIRPAERAASSSLIPGGLATTATGTPAVPSTQAIRIFQSPLSVPLGQSGPNSNSFPEALLYPWGSSATIVTGDLSSSSTVTVSNFVSDTGVWIAGQTPFSNSLPVPPPSSYALATGYPTTSTFPPITTSLSTTSIPALTGITSLSFQLAGTESAATGSGFGFLYIGASSSSVDVMLTWGVLAQAVTYFNGLTSKSSIVLAWLAAPKSAGVNGCLTAATYATTAAGFQTESNPSAVVAPTVTYSGGVVTVTGFASPMNVDMEDPKFMLVGTNSTVQALSSTGFNQLQYVASGSTFNVTISQSTAAPTAIV